MFKNTQAQCHIDKTNEVIQDFLLKNIHTFSKHLIIGQAVNLAINDCSNELDYTPVIKFFSIEKLIDTLNTIILNEVGGNYFVSWSDYVLFKYYDDTPNVIVFILSSPTSERIKINLFCNPEFKINDITIYKNTCNYF